MSSMRLVILALVVALSVFIFDRAATPLHAATILVSGAITTDTTWTSGNVYVINSADVTVISGVTLVIQPGVIVKFQGDGPGGTSYGQVANQRNLFVDGILIADGTAENPIYFTSLRDDTVGGDTNNDGANTVPAAGNWGRIEFRNTSTASLLDNVIVRYAGANDYNLSGATAPPVYYGAITLQDASPTISSSTFSNNARWGVYCAESIAPGTTRPSILNNAFTANAYYAVSVDMASFPTLSGNTLTNNGRNGMEVRGGTIATNSTWDQTSITYGVEGDVTIASGVALTISPGVIVKFQGDGPGGTSYGQVANQRNLFVDGILIADGTAENPIYFTSLRDDTVGGDTNNDGANTVPAAGNWGRIEFRNTSTASLLDNVIVRYAGANDYNLSGATAPPVYYPAIAVKDTAISIANTTIITNALHGVQTFVVIGSPTVTFGGCNSIHANNQYGVLHSGTQAIDAVNIWWGNSTGPFHSTLNPGGLGNRVSDLVTFAPWRTVPCDAPVASPTNLAVVSATSTQVALTWSDNASDESEYRIERAAQGDDPVWQEIAIIGPNSAQYVDSSLGCSSAPHVYRVRAYRASDQKYSVYSNIVTAATAPCPPANFQSALSGPTSAALAWQDASPDESEFKIERSSNNGVTWTTISTAPANATAYADSTLQCSVAYHFRVRALRTSDGAYSDYSNVATLRTAPCAPSGAVARNLANTTVELTWQDNAGDESEFQIERRVDSVATWTPFGVAPANTRSYIDSAAQCSTQFYYRVRSYRAEDGQPSAVYSNEATIRTAPCTPTALNATALSPSEISLAWTDNASDETGFLVELSLNSVVGWSESNVLGANATQHVAAPLTCETTYFFRVRAFRSTDNIFSPYSDSISATTADCYKIALPLIRR